MYSRLVRWLPELDFVALGVKDPTELAKIGFIDFIEYTATLVAQFLKHGRTSIPR
jgi:hypothetical protein